MAGLTDDREKRLNELKKEVTERGFDRHASALKTVSELPFELQSPTVTALAPRETLQTIIAFPPQIQRGWHYVPKQALLFTTTGLIHVSASIWPGEEPQITCLEGCSVLYVNITLILLYGALEIVAQGQNVPTRLTLEFNTVDWYYLETPLRRFLQATALNSLADKESCSSVTRQTLSELPLKFLNGVRIHGLLPGEELKELVFQPGTWKLWLYFFQQPASANKLLLLTSHYMVVIREEVDVKQGWIISYIPRDNITGIKNQPVSSWNELSVQLRRENQSVDYKLRLKDETAEVWRRQWVQRGGSWEDLPEQQN
ncbi:MAG TPA: hypothetical protein VHP14_26295 [Anaerolineales bacterium]|nr:hypothetical protein [Anaerolineales bacterium]